MAKKKLSAYQIAQRKRRAREKRERQQVATARSSARSKKAERARSAEGKRELARRQREKESRDLIAAEQHGPFVLKTPSTLKLYGYRHLDLPKGAEIIVQSKGRVWTKPISPIKGGKPTEFTLRFDEHSMEEKFARVLRERGATIIWPDGTQGRAPLTHIPPGSNVDVTFEEGPSFSPRGVYTRPVSQ